MYRAKDIAGIDLNCGCPKHFSIQGGMGAALLKTPETIEDIVKTLSNNLDKPVTIKIRLVEKVCEGREGRGTKRKQDREKLTKSEEKRKR